MLNVICLSSKRGDGSNRNETSEDEIYTKLKICATLSPCRAVVEAAVVHNHSETMEDSDKWEGCYEISGPNRFESERLEGCRSRSSISFKSQIAWPGR